LQFNLACLKIVPLESAELRKQTFAQIVFTKPHNFRKPKAIGSLVETDGGESIATM
jgi:hypothetical protein